MSKRRLDISLASTGEVKRWRDGKLDQLRKHGLENEEKILGQLEKMTAKDVRDFVVTSSKSSPMMLARILQVKALQKVDNGYLQLLQVHGFVKFNEPMLLKALLKECMSQKNGLTFLNRIVKYASQFCFNQPDHNVIMQWSTMMAIRSEYDWQKAFNNAVLSSPEKELQLLSTLIMLIPNPSPKHATRVYAALAKQEKLPECYDFLAKRAFQFVSDTAFHKSDMDNVTRKYLYDNYEKCWKKKIENKSKSQIPIQYAQNLFLKDTLQLANKAFKIVRSSDENAIRNLLQDPCFQMNKPSDLLIEFFLQYIKLGIFFFENGDKLIAWNYYYDDRWCGYDRSDLFGEKFQLSESFRWFADFRYAGTIKQHPHYTNLILCSKVYDWMSSDDKLFDTLMEKYADENFLQYLAVSLSFAGCFKHMITLYDKFIEKMRTRQGYICLSICYMYGCAKEGMAKEALLTWIQIMNRASKYDLLKMLQFPQNSFPLPYFVTMKHSGQFATRLLRNCLWTAALKNGTEGWKKYGMIILHLCDSLDDSFLNHNMIRIMFQKISLEDMHLIVRPGLEESLRHHHTYWDCLQIAKQRGFKVPKELLNKKLVPSSKNGYRDDPGFLLVFNKLKKLDEMFYEVMDDIPDEVFRDVTKKRTKSIKHLSAERQERIKKLVEKNKERIEKFKQMRLKRLAELEAAKRNHTDDEDSEQEERKRIKKIIDKRKREQEEAKKEVEKKNLKLDETKKIQKKSKETEVKKTKKKPEKDEVKTGKKTVVVDEVTKKKKKEKTEKINEKEKKRKEKKSKHAADTANSENHDKVVGVAENVKTNKANLPLGELLSSDDIKQEELELTKKTEKAKKVPSSGEVSTGDEAKEAPENTEKTVHFELAENAPVAVKEEVSEKADVKNRGEEEKSSESPSTNSKETSEPANEHSKREEPNEAKIETD